MSSVTTLISAMDEQLALTAKGILEEFHRRIAFFSDLRANRNSFLPVCRLPPETLAIIFIHGARDYYESSTGGFTSSIPPWVNVSYVCKYWRNVALNCPNLWTYHFATSPRWTKELLLRSKNASLKISCIDSYNHNYNVPLWPSIVDSLLKHSERIQELRLDLPSSWLPPKVTLCARRLETLDLRKISLPRFAITGSDKFPLHTLKLVDCSLPWCSFNLSGLHTLFLRNVDSPSPLNMIEVLTALSRLQNLTVLHLERVLPSARDFLSSEGLDVSPKINLPRLALLIVIEPVPTVVALVSCINIPPRAQVSLEPLLGHGSPIEDFVPIRSFLAQQFSQQSSSPIFHSLLYDASYTTLIFGLEYEHPSQSQEVGHNIPLKITLEVVDDEDGTDLAEWQLQHIMGDICLSLPLRNIQSLHVCWPQLFTDWREMFEYLSGIRRLKLSHGDMPNLSLLALPAPKSQENTAGEPILDQDPTSSHMFIPALEELELYQIMFAPDHTTSEDSMSQKALLDVLSTRKGLRDRLIMTECGLK